jgi:GT2 family glycosyltransferase
MPRPLVTIIVLNWNGSRLLGECLDSINGLLYDNIEVLVVDNASTDSSREVLQSYKGVRVITNASNLGYAAGNNVGFAAAKGEYIATLNNDVTVEPTWLVDPIAYLEQDESIGIIASRQMNYYDRRRIDGLYAHLDSCLLMKQAGRGEPYDDGNPLLGRPGFALGANGASAIYRKAMLDEIGCFDEAFYAYHEESDLCMRAFLRGWKCLYVPSAVVYHKASATFKNVPGALHFYAERNRVWFMYKYFPLSLLLRHAGSIFRSELSVIRSLWLRNRMPLVYVRARLAGLVGMFRYARQRRQNLRDFAAERERFRLLSRTWLVGLDRSGASARAFAGS